MLCKDFDTYWILVRWMPSHLDEKGVMKRNEASASGLVTLNDIEGNSMADMLAKNGAGEHADITQYEAAAKERRCVTVLAHKMYLAVCNAYIGQRDTEQKLADSSDSHEMKLLLENLQHDAGDDEYDYDPFAEDTTRPTNVKALQAAGLKDVSTVPRGLSDEPDMQGGAAANEPRGSADASSTSAASVRARDTTSECMKARFPPFGWEGASPDEHFTTAWISGKDPIFFGAVKAPNSGSESKRLKRSSYRIPTELWELFTYWLQDRKLSNLGLGPSPDEARKEQRRITWIELILAFQIMSGCRLSRHKLDLAD